MAGRSGRAQAVEHPADGLPALVPHGAALLLGGLRAVLAAHADRPALAAAHERDRRLVRRDLGIEVPSLGEDLSPARPGRRWRRSAPAA